MSHISTYLNDHCAGATFAIETLRRLGEWHEKTPLGEFLKKILREIEQDHVVLKEICARLDDESATFKEAASWLAERASRFKLRPGNDDKFATFESLEVLSLGVLGKQKLWQLLRVVAAQFPALQGFDYEQLAARAQAQHEELESWRQAVGSEAIGPVAAQR